MATTDVDCSPQEYIPKSPKLGFDVPVPVHEYAELSSNSIFNNSLIDQIKAKNLNNVKNDSEMAYTLPALLNDLGTYGIADDQPLLLPTLKKLLLVDDSLYQDEFVTRAYEDAFGETEYVTGKSFAFAYLQMVQQCRYNLEQAITTGEEIARLYEGAQSDLRDSLAREKHDRGDPPEGRLVLQILSIDNITHAPPHGSNKLVQHRSNNQMPRNEINRNSPNDNMLLSPHNGGSKKQLWIMQACCNDQIIETTPQSEVDGSVFINEIFSFEASDSSSDLIISLLDDEKNALCQTTVSLQLLQDQRKHNLTEELICNAFMSQLHVSVQWIYHRKKLLRSFVDELQCHDDENKQNIIKMKTEYNEMYAPIECFSKSSALGYESISSSIDSIVENFQLSNFTTFLQLSVGFSLLLCCVSQFLRCNYYDLGLLLCSFWANIDPRRWSPKGYYGFIAALIGSMCMDAFWIGTYFSIWRVPSHDTLLHSITKTGSIFHLLWKAVVVLLHWKALRDYKKFMSQTRYESTYNVWMSKPMSPLDSNPSSSPKS